MLCRMGSAEAAPEKNRRLLDEPVEDLGDEQGGKDIDQEEAAHRNVTHQGMEENEENGSVNEVEAVGDFAEVMDRPAG